MQGGGGQSSSFFWESMDQRPVCKLEFFRCGPLEKNRELYFSSIFADFLTKFTINVTLIRVHIIFHCILTLRSIRYQILWLPWGMLSSIFHLVNSWVTCKKTARNPKIWARFQDFKIFRNWDFASPWQTKYWQNLHDFKDIGLKF